MILTCSFPDGKEVEIPDKRYETLVNRAWDLHMKHPDALLKIGEEVIVRGYLYKEPEA